MISYYNLSTSLLQPRWCKEQDPGLGRFDADQLVRFPVIHLTLSRAVLPRFALEAYQQASTGFILDCLASLSAADRVVLLFKLVRCHASLDVGYERPVTILAQFQYGSHHRLTGYLVR